MQMLQISLLLLAGAVTVNGLTEEQLELRKLERLTWLTVTKPNAKNLEIHCKSQFDYPFSLLWNDTNSIGNQIKRMWWIFPDRSSKLANYSDGNIMISSDATYMRIATVTEATHGLYHCAAEAELPDNNTITKYYYYKKGLNLYGADVYNNLWEKYRGNLLSAVLTSGSFLALVGAYAILNKIGTFDKFRNSEVGPMSAASDSDSATAAAAASGKKINGEQSRSQEMEMEIEMRSQSKRSSRSSASPQSGHAASMSSV